MVNPFSSSKTLRIGFDAKRAFNNRTGLGNYSRFVISGMIKHFPQHQYYLFTASVKSEFEHFYTPSKNIKLVTPENFLGKQFPALWRTYAIANLCNELQLDVYHGLSNELPVGIEKFKGKKLVTIHDLIFLRYPSYYKFIDREIYTRKFKAACKNTDVVIAASHQTQKDLEQLLHVSSTKIKVVYQNCDEQFSKVLTSTQIDTCKSKYNLPKKFIVCIGTIEERKNQLAVLKAFHKADVDLSLVFVGKQTAYAQQLHQYITAHALQSKVCFIEGAAFADFPAFYQAAEMAVYASEFEGFGIPILEALRSGTKTIAANTSSLPEVGGKAVVYFEQGNEAQLSTLIKRTLNETANANLTKAQLEKFDTELLMKQLMEEYEFI